MDADTMATLDARMERMESALQRMVNLLDQIQPKIAMAVDIADDWAENRIGGDPLESRLAAVENALLRVTEPATLDSLVRLAEMGPRLQGITALAASFDDTVAMATDVADEWIREEGGGAAFEARLLSMRDAALAMSEPNVASALGQLASLAPRLVGSAKLAADLDEFVASTSAVLAEPAQPVGFFGLMSALGDPAIQKGLGRMLNITRHLGRHETLLPAKR